MSQTKAQLVGGVGISTADDFTIYGDLLSIDTTVGTGVTINSNGNASFAGVVTATSFSGDGSALSGISAGATGGGSDQIFYENGQEVTVDYTISTSKNAMSAGPVGIATGITVTIPSGSTWTIV